MADESMENEEHFGTVGDSTQNGDELNASNQTDELDDPDLEMIKARVKEMEEEAEKIKQMQNEVEKMAHNTSEGGTLSSASGNLLSLSFEDKLEIDARSIYVGNVDYGATAEELEQHFHGCGSINRVTIQCDKYSGHPKGFAYIEFADKDSVSTSAALDESLFRGRQIKVLPKRTNRPGISTTNRAPRGRFRGRSARISYYSGYRPMRRSVRRRSWFYPY